MGRQRGYSKWTRKASERTAHYVPGVGKSLERTLGMSPCPLRGDAGTAQGRKWSHAKSPMGTNGGDSASAARAWGCGMGSVGKRPWGLKGMGGATAHVVWGHSRREEVNTRRSSLECLR